MQWARTIGELRQAAGPEWADASDEEILLAYHRATGLPLARVAGMFGYDPGRGSMNRERLSAAIDRYQASLYDVAGHAADAVGANSASDFFHRQRLRNEVQAQVAAERARNLGAIDSFRDVDSVGDAVNYVTGLGIQSLPYIGEAAAAAITGGAALGPSIGVRAGRLLGAVAGSYPSAVGDILQSQRDQADQTDFPTALAGGVPHAALTVMGLEGAFARGQLFRNTVGALDRLRGVRGGLARASATGARVGFSEGVSETGQEAINQLGRMAVDPNETFFNPASVERFAESFVGGAVLGGAIGGAAGGWRRGEPNLTAPGADLLEGGNVSQDTRPQFELVPPTEPTGPNLPPAPADLLVQGADPRQLELFFPNGEPTYHADPSFGFTFDAPPVQNIERDPRVTPFLDRQPSGTPGADIPAIGVAGEQGDLFSIDEAPLQPFSRYPREVAEEPVDTGPDPRQGDLFADRPTATVRTDFAPHQIVRQLRQANGGKNDPYVLKLASRVSELIDSPAKLDEFLADEQERLFASKASTQTVERRQRVLDAAVDVAERFKQRMLDAQAQEGAARSRPGVRVGTEPGVESSVQAIRERNAAMAAAEAKAARAENLEARERRLRLDRILADDLTRNPFTRFTAELKKAGLDPNITPEERERILRYQDLKAAFARGVQGELNIGQEPTGSVLPPPEPALKPERAGRDQPKKQLGLFDKRKPQPVAAEPAAAPQDTTKYDGVSVRIPVRTGERVRQVTVKDAGKALREIDAKVSKYEQLIKCLTR